MIKLYASKESSNIFVNFSYNAVFERGLKHRRSKALIMSYMVPIWVKSLLNFQETVETSEKTWCGMPITMFE